MKTFSNIRWWWWWWCSGLYLSACLPACVLFLLFISPPVAHLRIFGNSAYNYGTRQWTLNLFGRTCRNGAETPSPPSVAISSSSSSCSGGHKLQSSCQTEYIYFWDHAVSWRGAQQTGEQFLWVTLFRTLPSWHRNCICHADIVFTFCCVCVCPRKERLPRCTLTFLCGGAVVGRGVGLA